MNQVTYAAQVHSALGSLGFSGLAGPAPLMARTVLLLERPQEWGHLLLAVAPLDMVDSADRAELAGLVAAAAAALAGTAGFAPRVWAVVVFPFTRPAGDELCSEIRALRQEEPGRWGEAAWTADLASGLVDHPGGFPRLEPAVARALTEPKPEEAAPLRPYRAEFGPADRSRLRVRLDHVPATRTILAATVAWYLWVALVGRGSSLLGGPGLQDLLRWGANHGQLVIVQGQHWRLLTHVFLHGGLMHLGFNMWALWNLGRHVELMFGPSRMAFIYTVAGVAGGIASTVLRPRWVPSVGASGAIFGLMGALLYVGLSSRGRTIDWRGVLGPVFINLLLGFMWAGVDNYAHVGGLAGGFVAAWAAGAPGERQPWRTKAMAALGLFAGFILSGLARLPHLSLWP